jgi:F-type H+-transporting ATPase subunit delta
MRDSTIARNYAQALLTLGMKAGTVDDFGALMNALATAVRENVLLRRFLEAPQVAPPVKREILKRALSQAAPRLFVLFIDKLVDNRRQALLPEIAIEYGNLVDAHEGRVHANVMVARPPRPGEADELSKRLSDALGKSVVAHLQVNPAILGGVVVRLGDTVMDGSVRRRLNSLRQALTGATHSL